MDKGNAIIIILLILIVLSAGVYAIVTGAGISFNKEDQIGQSNYTVNNTTATVNNTNVSSDVTRDTGIYAPSSSEESYYTDNSYSSDYSYSYSYDTPSYDSQQSVSQESEVSVSDTAEAGQSEISENTGTGDLE